ncbi:MAG: GTP-binding protein, partial [Erysipelotrichaceae bacterium]|nr:GTP-binding protein [Erysipelotrichaceae bacterium]
MKEYAGIDVRNVCLTGHTGAGKTEVLESILFNQKITERFGKAVDGNSIIDSDPEEVKRGMSVYTSLVPVEWKNKKINFMDAPGYLDFAGEQAAAMAVCENVVIVVNAKDGVQSGTMKAYRQAVAAGKPVIFFVTRVDEENANFENVVAELERRCKAAPLVLPVIEGGKAVGTVNIITKKAVIGGKEAEIPADFTDQVEARYAELCEAIAMTDDELTEKFLMEEPFTEEEMLKGVKNGMVSGAIKPIICGSATKYVGIEDLLNIIVDYCHSYVEKGEVKGKDDRGNEVVMKTTPDEAFSAFIFKTVNDAFAQISYVKVMSGTLTTDVAAYNCNKEENEKIGSIIT